jgi:hypothetical protein
VGDVGLLAGAPRRLRHDIGIAALANDVCEFIAELGARRHHSSGT